MLHYTRLHFAVLYHMVSYRIQALAFPQVSADRLLKTPVAPRPLAHFSENAPRLAETPILQTQLETRVSFGPLLWACGRPPLSFAMPASAIPHFTMAPCTFFVRTRAAWTERPSCALPRRKCVHVLLKRHVLPETTHGLPRPWIVWSLPTVVDLAQLLRPGMGQTLHAIRHRTIETSTILGPAHLPLLCTNVDIPRPHCPPPAILGPSSGLRWALSYSCRIRFTELLRSAPLTHPCTVSGTVGFVQHRSIITAIPLSKSGLSTTPLGHLNKFGVKKWSFHNPARASLRFRGQTMDFARPRPRIPAMLRSYAPP